MWGDAPRPGGLPGPEPAVTPRPYLVGAGRPRRKALRDRLGLEPGQALEAQVEDGRLVLQPEASRVVLVRRGGRLVATAAGNRRVLSNDEVLQAIEETRQWPRPGL